MSKKPARSHGAQLEPFIAPFRFNGSGEFHLKSHKTNDKGGLDKDKAEKILAANKKRLSDFQEKLYAQNSWSLLLIFQGMDAAGKDSAIKSIFDGVNPQGCEVHPFKQPSPNELEHDFMWRCVMVLPERGHIGIFNRSYYEECLVTRVHPELLAKEKIPPKLITKNIWRERFEDSCEFEAYLSRKDTGIRQLLQDIVRHTSMPIAPWYVVPADHKWFARVVIGSAIVSALESLNLHFPRVDKASLEGFKQEREALLAEGKGGARKALSKGAS